MIVVFICIKFLATADTPIHTNSTSLNPLNII